MLPLATTRTPRARAERMLITRVVIAVGLALLLVVGAWSTAHGPGDTHGTLCLAAGVSAPADAPDAPAAVAPADPVDADAVVCAVAALCGVALALLLHRLLARRSPGPLALLTRAAAPPRAMCLRFPSTPSLTELSISRT
ncbi:hypothetical protein [Microbacterium sp. p3-SID336]|uniref:hypothetical protein n=1 Tax=Microbacterium sp. p3-SID336 TaxID=2916212 RepID=UPI0021A58E27|nr:hypothetical protein [Microbacterium sp. p3-SID336]MCT1479628.1 hypothetical protein [Microbacterium sp. p3-SID336]